MKILMAASELAPLVRSGQLADAMAELSGGLRRLGHDVSFVLPYYRTIREDKSVRVKKSKQKFAVPVGASRLPCEVYETKADGVTVYLVARDEYFDRSGIYGVDGRDYQDNAARFIFLTKCVLEIARRMEMPPDILHANSWETALLPVFVRDQRLPFHTVLTPHGLEYQGNFWSYDFALTNLPGEYFSARGVEYYGSMNCLKAGVLFADAVVLPGERFVSAAQTPEFGCGLDAVLRENQHKLVGIPAAGDEALWRRRGSPDRSGALSAFSLRPQGAQSLIAAIARPGDLAGTAAVLASLDRLLVDGTRLVLLGSVSGELIQPLEVARRKHAGRFAYSPSDDEASVRQAFSGADLFLVPSPVEPHAVWLRRAMAAGVIPVAAHCGGLFQFVREWDAVRDAGNGFVFASNTADGLLDACRNAIRETADPLVRRKLADRCAAQDFSSPVLAAGHAALYERLTGHAQPAMAA